jgi:hypothetical protein
MQAGRSGRSGTAPHPCSQQQQKQQRAKLNGIEAHRSAACCQHALNAATSGVWHLLHDQQAQGVTHVTKSSIAVHQQHQYVAQQPIAITPLAPKQQYK